MKYFLLIVALASSMVFASEDKGRLEAPKEIWVSGDNFMELPHYQAIQEINDRPTGASCLSDSCNKAMIDEEVFYRAILLSNDNYSARLVGAWTGSTCDNDWWKLDDAGFFDSSYPLDGEAYSWHGEYLFKDGRYIEEGVNDDGEKELNEAYLYFVPDTEVVIYKGVRSFESYNEDGSINYLYYRDDDFLYFDKCEE